MSDMKRPTRSATKSTGTACILDFCSWRPPKLLFPLSCPVHQACLQSHQTSRQKLYQSQPGHVKMSQRPACFSHIHATSNRLTTIPSRWILFTLPLYLLCLYATTEIERNISRSHDAQATNFTRRLPDKSPQYNLTQLGDFLDSANSVGRWYYGAYLLMEIPSLICWTVLLTMTISAIALPLAAAEGRILGNFEANKSKDKRVEAFTQIDPASIASSPFLPTLLNILPVLISALDIAENGLLFLAMMMFDPTVAAKGLGSVAQIAVNVTRFKWILSRLFIVFAIITIIAGWLRVFTFRLKTGEPLFGRSPSFIPIQPGSRPRGLSPAGMVSNTTWKPPADGRVNNKKKKHRK